MATDDSLRLLAQFKRQTTAPYCWLWQGNTNADGYGITSRGEAVHRKVWALTNGPIPENALILHRCDTPPCGNPAHNYAGTHADNMRDRVARNPKSWPAGDQHWTRQFPNQIARGEKAPKAKLTEAKVVEIRARYATGGVSMRALATEYGIKVPSVHRVIHRLSWAHVA